MAKALIWCEVICCHCGGMAISSDFYSPETIRRLKAETKTGVKTEHDGKLTCLGLPVTVDMLNRNLIYVGVGEDYALELEGVKE